jgi:phenylalanyl-tRNA synthetase beta chain
VLGIARETALGFGLPLTMPTLNLKEDAAAGDATEVVRIDIPDGELCPVYRARVLEKLKLSNNAELTVYAIRNNLV